MYLAKEVPKYMSERTIITKALYLGRQNQFNPIPETDIICANLIIQEFVRNKIRIANKRRESMPTMYYVCPTHSGKYSGTILSPLNAGLHDAANICNSLNQLRHKLWNFSKIKIKNSKINIL